MSPECQHCDEPVREGVTFCRDCIEDGAVVECPECGELFVPADADQVLCEDCAELDEEEDDEDASPVATPDYRQRLRDVTAATIEAHGAYAVEQYCMQMMSWLRRKSGVEYDPAIPAMPRAFKDAARAMLGDFGPEVAEAIVLPLLPGLERRPEGTKGDPWGWACRRA